MSNPDFTDTESGSYESKAESDATRASFVARWLAEIELAGKAEEGWRKEAEMAREVYRAEKSGDAQRFNILFSNVQTSVPALYNSTPTPDVRTRYADDNEVSRVSGQAIERILSYSVDTYNFDGTIRSSVQDRELAGRGAARVRYVPYDYQGKVYQEVSCEHTAWKHLRFGPATRWEDMPWLAFEHFLTRDQMIKLTEGSPQANIGHNLNLDVTLSEGTDSLKPDTAPNVFKRAHVWEIWDKTTRKVIWIAKAYAAGPIREDDDPLGLIGFFPMPEPLYAVRTSDSMTPICPYRIVKPLVEELEDITVRIQALVRVCKWRGFRHPAIPFDRLEEAEDGVLVAPLDGAEILSLVQAGDLGKFIWLMPLQELVTVLQQLYLQREQIKQTIFEVSGMADIMRGQTNPNETLGAQEIKANFGTMRLQDAQKDVQRFCRDLFRLKAEIACNMFDSQNLAIMTGLNLPSRQDVAAAKQQLAASAGPPAMGHNGGPPMGPPPGPQGPMGGPPPNAPPMMGAAPPAGPQPPMPPAGAQAQPPAPPPPPPELVKLAQTTVTWEDVLETLKSGVMRTYRIDVETDSTIRGDVRQAQQMATAFLQGTGQFFQSIGPAVQMGAMPMDVAIDLYSSIVRTNFKMGKQAEDALARWGQEVQKTAKEPKGPPPPDPEMLKLEAEKKRHEAEMGFKTKQAAEDAALKARELQHAAQLQQAEFQHQTRLEQFKASEQAKLAQDKRAQEYQATQAELAKQRELATAQAALEERKLAHQAQLKEREMAHQYDLEGRKAAQQAQTEARRIDLEQRKHEDQKSFDREQFGEKMALDWERQAGGDAKGASKRVPAFVKTLQEQTSDQTRITKILAAQIADQQKLQASLAAEAGAAVERARALEAGLERIAAMLSEQMAAAKRPKVIIRDDAGRAVGVETGHGRFGVVRDATGRAVGLDATTA